MSGQPACSQTDKTDQTDMTDLTDAKMSDATGADAGIVARAVAGDAGAFRLLVERYQPRIIAVLERLSGCP